MSELEKVVEKLRKIKTHAVKAEELGDMAEAQIFAKKMREMMLQHELTMSDLEFDEKLNEPVEEYCIDWTHHGYYNLKKRQGWVEHLAQVVAIAYGCEIMVVNKSNLIVLVGHRSNREIAEYTLGTLVRAAAKISDKEYYKRWQRNKKDPMGREMMKGYKACWLSGFCDKIRARFEAAGDKFKRDKASSLALVRVDKEAVQVREHIKAKDDLIMAKAIKQKRHNREAYLDGAEYADNMDIDGKAVPPADDKDCKSITIS